MRSGFSVLSIAVIFRSFEAWAVVAKQVTGDQQQVYYDHRQPSGDDISENPRFKRDPNSSHNFDHAYDKHQHVQLYG